MDRASEVLLNTNLGPMTPSQIAEEVEFSWYRNQRHYYGIPAQRLAGFVGEEPGQRLEARYMDWYRAEMKKNAAIYIREKGLTEADLPECYGVPKGVL